MFLDKLFNREPKQEQAPKSPTPSSGVTVDQLYEIACDAPIAKERSEQVNAELARRRAEAAKALADFDAAYIAKRKRREEEKCWSVDCSLETRHSKSNSDITHLLRLEQSSQDPYTPKVAPQPEEVGNLRLFKG